MKFPRIIGLGNSGKNLAIALSSSGRQVKWSFKVNKIRKETLQKLLECYFNDMDYNRIVKA